MSKSRWKLELQRIALRESGTVGQKALRAVESRDADALVSIFRSLTSAQSPWVYILVVCSLEKDMRHPRTWRRVTLQEIQMAQIYYVVVWYGATLAVQSMEWSRSTFGSRRGRKNTGRTSEMKEFERYGFSCLYHRIDYLQGLRKIIRIAKEICIHAAEESTEQNVDSVAPEERLNDTEDISRVSGHSGVSEFQTKSGEDDTSSLASASVSAATSLASRIFPHVTALRGRWMFYRNADLATATEIHVYEAVIFCSYRLIDEFLHRNTDLTIRPILVVEEAFFKTTTMLTRMMALIACLSEHIDVGIELLDFMGMDVGSELRDMAIHTLSYNSRQRLLQILVRRSDLGMVDITALQEGKKAREYLETHSIRSDLVTFRHADDYGAFAWVLQGNIVITNADLTRNQSPADFSALASQPLLYALWRRFLNAATTHTQPRLDTTTDILRRRLTRGGQRQGSGRPDWHFVTTFDWELRWNLTDWALVSAELTAMADVDNENASEGWEGNRRDVNAILYALHGHSANLRRWINRYHTSRWRDTLVVLQLARGDIFMLSTQETLSNIFSDLGYIIIPDRIVGKSAKIAQWYFHWFGKKAFSTLLDNASPELPARDSNVKRIDDLSSDLLAYLARHDLWRPAQILCFHLHVDHPSSGDSMVQNTLSSFSNAWLDSVFNAYRLAYQIGNPVVEFRAAIVNGLRLRSSGKKELTRKDLVRLCQDLQEPFTHIMLLYCDSVLGTVSEEEAEGLLVLVDLAEYPLANGLLYKTPQSTATVTDLLDRAGYSAITASFKQLMKSVNKNSTTPYASFSRQVREENLDAVSWNAVGLDFLYFIHNGQPTVAALQYLDKALQDQISTNKAHQGVLRSLLSQICTESELNLRKVTASAIIAGYIGCFLNQNAHLCMQLAYCLRLAAYFEGPELLDYIWTILNALENPNRHDQAFLTALMNPLEKAFFQQVHSPFMSRSVVITFANIVTYLQERFRLTKNPVLLTAMANKGDVPGFLLHAQIGGFSPQVLEQIVMDSAFSAAFIQHVWCMTREDPRVGGEYMPKQRSSMSWIEAVIRLHAHLGVSGLLLTVAWNARLPQLCIVAADVEGAPLSHCFDVFLRLLLRNHSSSGDTFYTSLHDSQILDLETKATLESAWPAGDFDFGAWYEPLPLDKAKITDLINLAIQHRRAKTLRVAYRVFRPEAPVLCVVEILCAAQSSDVDLAIHLVDEFEMHHLSMAARDIEEARRLCYHYAATCETVSEMIEFAQVIGRSPGLDVNGIYKRLVQIVDIMRVHAGHASIDKDLCQAVLGQNASGFTDILCSRNLLNTGEQVVGLWPEVNKPLQLALVLHRHTKLIQTTTDTIRLGHWWVTAFDLLMTMPEPVTVTEAVRLINAVLARRSLVPPADNNKDDRAAGVDVSFLSIQESETEPNYSSAESTPRQFDITMGRSIGGRVTSIANVDGWPRFMDVNRWERISLLMIMRAVGGFDVFIDPKSTVAAVLDLPSGATPAALFLREIVTEASLVHERVSSESLADMDKKLHRIMAASTGVWLRERVPETLLDWYAEWADAGCAANPCLDRSRDHDPFLRQLLRHGQVETVEKVAKVMRTDRIDGLWVEWRNAVSSAAGNPQKMSHSGPRSPLPSSLTAPTPQMTLIGLIGTAKERDYRDVARDLNKKTVRHKWLEQLLYHQTNVRGCQILSALQAIDPETNAEFLSLLVNEVLEEVSKLASALVPWEREAEKPCLKTIKATWSNLVHSVICCEDVGPFERKFTAALADSVGSSGNVSVEASAVHSLVGLSFLAILDVQCPVLSQSVHERNARAAFKILIDATWLSQIFAFTSLLPPHHWMLRTLMSMLIVRGKYPDVMASESLLSAQDEVPATSSSDMLVQDSGEDRGSAQDLYASLEQTFLRENLADVRPSAQKGPSAFAALVYQQTENRRALGLRFLYRCRELLDSYNRDVGQRDIFLSITGDSPKEQSSATSTPVRPLSVFSGESAALLPECELLCDQLLEWTKEAERLFLQAGCYALADRSRLLCDMAILLSGQRRKLSAQTVRRFWQLSRIEVRDLMRSVPTFANAYTLSRYFGVTTDRDWAVIIYERCIAGNDPRFWQDYLTWNRNNASSLSGELVGQIKAHGSLSARSARTARKHQAKLVALYGHDKIVQMQLMELLGIEDFDSLSTATPRPASGSASSTPPGARSRSNTLQGRLLASYLFGSANSLASETGSAGPTSAPLGVTMPPGSFSPLSEQVAPQPNGNASASGTSSPLRSTADLGDPNTSHPAPRGPLAFSDTSMGGNSNVGPPPQSQPYSRWRQTCHSLVHYDIAKLGLDPTPDHIHPISTSPSAD
eukprot:Clim_evm22s145 gene=Clim_evmTU22s145